MTDPVDYLQDKLDHADLRAPLLPPCPACGFEGWPEGGMHAARSIHLGAHERAEFQKRREEPEATE